MVPYISGINEINYISISNFLTVLPSSRVDSVCLSSYPAPYHPLQSCREIPSPCPTTEKAQHTSKPTTEQNY